MHLRLDDHDGQTVQVAIETDAGLHEIVPEYEIVDRRIVLWTRTSKASRQALSGALD